MLKFLNFQKKIKMTFNNFKKMVNKYLFLAY